MYFTFNKPVSCCPVAFLKSGCGVTQTYSEKDVNNVAVAYSDFHDWGFFCDQNADIEGMVVLIYYLGQVKLLRIRSYAHCRQQFFYCQDKVKVTTSE